MENNNEPVNEAPKFKVCTITLVNPGLPDSVIKVTPAEHEREKIWLDRQPGVERWNSIKSLMTRFCERGKYVPEPAYWNPPSGKQEDLSVVILKAEDIPVVFLDGAVLCPPPADDRSSRPKTEDLSKVEKARIMQLEDQVNKLTTSITDMMAKMSQPQPAAVQQTEPKKKGRPRKVKEVANE